jgi:hypothetical protein
LIPALTAASIAAVMLAGCASDPDNEDAAAAPTPDSVAERDDTRSLASSEKPDVTDPGFYPRACFNPHGGDCLGPLAAGSHITTRFRPTIGYTTPEGWVNGEDLPGNFLLYREDDPQDGFEGGSYVGIYTDIRAPKRCEEGWVEGVGHTPAELATWYRQHPGLAASKPRRVEVGGLQGVLLDVPLKAGWQGVCPWSQSHPVVPVIIGSGVSDLHHVSVHGIDVRLVLLEWRDTNVTIEITSVRKQHSKQEYLELVEPIIESLRFH